MIDLQDTLATVILFRREDRICAEVVGPRGHPDLVAAMPEALGLAEERVGSSHLVGVLDDEGLWQPAWGVLLGQAEDTPLDGAWRWVDGEE